MKHQPHNYAILFPGGGVHYTGMGRKLYESYEVAKVIFDQAEDILQKPLKKWCFETVGQTLSMNTSLLCTYVCSIAAYETFCTRFAFQPEYMAGHSLGEYSALTCSRVLTFEDGLRLVDARSKLLEARGGKEPAMVAVNKLAREKVQALCDRVSDGAKSLFIAVSNGAAQYVVAGLPSAIHKLQVSVTQHGGNATILDIYSPSHCNLMDDVANDFHEVLKSVKFSLPEIPVIANGSGRPYCADSDFRLSLSDHLRKEVRWFDSIKFLLDSGIEYLIDIGPKSILKQMLYHIDPSCTALAFEEAEDVKRLESDSRFGCRRLERLLKNLLAIAASAPNEELDETKYSKVYQAYFRLQSLATGRIPDRSGVNEAINLLDEILAIKKVPDVLREQYYKQYSLTGIREFNVEPRVIPVS